MKEFVAAAKKRRKGDLGFENGDKPIDGWMDEKERKKRNWTIEGPVTREVLVVGSFTYFWTSYLIYFIV